MSKNYTNPTKVITGVNTRWSYADVQYTNNGIYVTFSKYMNETTLTTANFTINGSAPSAISFVEQGHTASNRTDNNGALTYTRTVKLTPASALALNNNVALVVESAVKSYAGTTMAADYTENGITATPQTVATPVISPGSGIRTYGTAITITCPTADSAIYYTTNGTIPTSASSRYTTAIPVTNNFTLKAIAVKPGCNNSQIASATYTVTGVLPVTPDNPGNNNGGSGGGGAAVVPPAEITTQTPATIPTTIEGVSLTHSNEMSEGQFSDVKSGAWYESAVKFAYEYGLFKGISDTQFEPSASMTRAMLVTVLYRMKGSPAVTGNSFSDVQDGKWYAQAVEWAAASGIVKGIGNGMFGPSRDLTREQLAVILYNFAKVNGMTMTAGADLSGYTDADGISSYAREAMAWAVSVGIITGSDNSLRPSDGATRAETAAMLQRLLLGSNS